MNKAFFWLCSGATLLSALVSAFFSILPLADSTLASHVVLLYVVSRSLAILAVVVVVVARKSIPGLVAMTFTMTLVQLFDVLPGLFANDFIGPLVLCVLNLVTGLLLVRHQTR